MNNTLALLLTMIIGLFILLGSFIAYKIKDNKKIVCFSISVAFGVMIALIFLELIPEAYELLTPYRPKPFNHFMIIGFSLLGLVIVRILDIFVPDHKSLHESKKSYYHIGYITVISLVLHNIIEGIAIYTTATSSIKSGILIAIGVGLHNIPLGMVVTSTLYQNNKDKKKTIIQLVIISLSTFIGGLLIFVLNTDIINNFRLGILLCITIGMISYVTLFELLPHLVKEKDKKTMIIGTVIGLVVLFISRLF